MRVLVTGGAGFVGTNLIKRLLKDDHEVVSVDNYSTGKKENEQDGCEYFDRDLSNVNWWSLYDVCQCELTCDCQIEPVDVIYHLAALARIQPSFKDPMKYLSIDIMGTSHVCELARRCNAKIVYAGSSSAFGGPMLNPYAFAKYTGEQVCEMFSQVFGLKCSIARFFNVYGERQPTTGPYATVVGVCEKQYSEKKPLTVTGTGNQRRDFTHIDDIVDAMMRVVYCNKWGSVYELGRGKNYSINEVAEMFLTNGEFSGISYKDPIYIDEIPGETRNTLCKSELARKKLKWEPKINLKDWIGEQI